MEVDDLVEVGLQAFVEELLELQSMKKKLQLMKMLLQLELEVLQVLELPVAQADAEESTVEAMDLVKVWVHQGQHLQ